MTKFLIQLFEAPEVDFRHHINDWEVKSGRKSIDIRLTHQIKNSSKEILAYLGLAEDASSKEVYHALNHLLDKENTIIEKSLGVSSESTPDEVIRKILSFLKTKRVVGESYFMKPAKIKGYIKKQPPKKIMKILGYRSVDSLLKRESDGLIISVAKELESTEWQKEYARFCSNLVGSDFHIQDIHISLVPLKSRERMKHAKIEGSYLVRQTSEVGDLSLIPAKRRFKNDSITYLTAILDGVYQLRLCGSYFNYLSFGKDFGKKFSRAVFSGIRDGTTDELSMQWPSIYREMAKTSIDDPLIIDEKIDRPADILKEYFEFNVPWHKFDQVVFGDKELVSLNLLDVVTNSSNNFEFAQRYIHTAQQEIWDRLSYEYLKGGVRL
ncbi:MAG: hypothetical protein AAB423_01655 [Patescibacteria group bacterium]